MSASARHRCFGPLTRPPSEALRNGDEPPRREAPGSVEALT
jgi:hypothetical protein